MRARSINRIKFYGMVKLHRKKLKALRKGRGKGLKQDKESIILLTNDYFHLYKKPKIRIKQGMAHLKRSLKILSVSLVFILGLAPVLSAFEAHVVGVNASIVHINPPILTPPGDVPWDSLEGGTDLNGEIDVVMSNDDEDAPYIFYNYGPGTDPDSIPEPICGATGGEKDAPQHLVIFSDTVIKAIACDGLSPSSNHSVTNTKVYIYEQEDPPEIINANSGETGNGNANENALDNPSNDRPGPLNNPQSLNSPETESETQSENQEVLGETLIEQPQPEQKQKEKEEAKAPMETDNTNTEVKTLEPEEQTETQTQEPSTSLEINTNQ
jgi:hypothetical protein